MTDTEYTRGFKAGYDFGYKDAANENRYNTGVKVGIAYEHDRIIKLLEIGGPIEQIICDYWGNPDFDKDDALALIEKAITGETK